MYNVHNVYYCIMYIVNVQHYVYDEVDPSIKLTILIIVKTQNIFNKLLQLRKFTDPSLVCLNLNYNMLNNNILCIK